MTIRAGVTTTGGDIIAGSSLFQSYDDGGELLAPQGIVSITDVSVSGTTVTASYTYSEGDATGFEYRIDGGTPVTFTDSTLQFIDSTNGTKFLEIRATNSEGEGAWSSPEAFTIDVAVAERAIAIRGSLGASLPPPQDIVAYQGDRLKLELTVEDEPEPMAMELVISSAGKLVFERALTTGASVVIFPVETADMVPFRAYSWQIRVQRSTNDGVVVAAGTIKTRRSLHSAVNSQTTH